MIELQYFLTNCEMDSALEDQLLIFKKIESNYSGN